MGSTEIVERMVRHKTHECLPDNRMLRCTRGLPNAEWVSFAGPQCTGAESTEPAPASGVCHNDGPDHWMTWECGLVGNGLAVLQSFNAADCPSNAVATEITLRRYVVGECEPYGAMHALIACNEDNGFQRAVYKDSACTELVYTGEYGECSNDRSRSSKAVSCVTYGSGRGSATFAKQAIV